MPEPPASSHESWARPALDARLADTRFTDVRWFDEIDSTNRYLLDRAAAGDPEGVVAVADVQTAGRGRLGRRWEAPPGSSLLVSVLLRPALSPDDFHLVTLAVALAAADTVRELAGIDVGVKWPNDLVVGDRKIAGVLAETLPGGAVVVGMGLNVSWSEVPEHLEGIATACNLESPTEVSRRELLAEWLLRLDQLLDDLTSEAGRELVRTRAIQRSATLGRRVRVVLVDAEYEGEAVGLTRSGHLEVRRDDGTVEEVTAGDVVNVRSA